MNGGRTRGGDLRERMHGAEFDTAVVGGGIYGVLLALEGAARGQRVLLVERDDFGGTTTFNSLRTIHGGLRYLQFMDVRRALKSNAQRRWWLQQFPDLVQPIRCLMPLHGEGLRRPATLRLALLASRLLGLGRDGQGRPGRAELMSADEVRRAVPHCIHDGLQGGAVWEDAFMPQSPRVVIECLRWAHALGAVPLNRVACTGASRVDEQRPWRLELRGQGTHDGTATVRADRVINAAGAAVDAVAALLTDGRAQPMLVPTLAWNLLLRREPVSTYSVAVKPPGPGRRTYFVHPFHGRALAGTGHAGLDPSADQPTGVADADVEAMLGDLNQALPGIALTREDVLHVFWGVLPGVSAGTDGLLMRPRLVDHGRDDGAPGAWSVMGVKFTEAPFVARSVWDRILGRRRGPLPQRPAARSVPTADEAGGWTDQTLAGQVRELLHEEWCADVNDVLCRRTDFWMQPSLRERVTRLASDG